MAQNSPTPGAKFNPAAAPPKGSKKLPGAKGPGDPKVANPVKKAQSKSVGKGNSTDRAPINVTVHARRDYNEVSNIEAERSFADLKFHASMPLAPGGALGPSSVMPGSNPASGASIKGKRVKALDSLSDKEPGNKEHEVALNPKFAASKTIDMCAKCGGMHAEGGKCMKAGGPGSGRRPGGAMGLRDKYTGGSRGQHEQLLKQTQKMADEATTAKERRKWQAISNSHAEVLRDFKPKVDGMGVKSAGHSRGAKKGWSTRGKGHLSKKEKKAHYETIPQAG